MRPAHEEIDPHCEGIIRSWTVAGRVCTLTVAWRVFDDYLAVAANRDESLARPASPPAVRGESPSVLAPRDEQASGTWIGYNEHGTLVALTNRWTAEPREGDRSRGLLVREALDRGSAADAAAFVREELDARTYEPFHLFVADADRAVLFEHDVDDSWIRLAPGVHVVGNTGWCGVRAGPRDATERQRTETFFVPGRHPEVGRRHAENERGVLHALVDASAPADDAEAWLDVAGDVISDHSFGVCVHGDDPEAEGTAAGSSDRRAETAFGTRSSSLVRLGETRSWRHAEGPPCENPYETVDPL